MHGAIQSLGEMLAAGDMREDIEHVTDVDSAAEVDSKKPDRGGVNMSLDFALPPGSRSPSTVDLYSKL